MKGLTVHVHIKSDIVMLKKGKLLKLQVFGIIITQYFIQTEILGWVGTFSTYFVLSASGKLPIVFYGTYVNNVNYIIDDVVTKYCS